MKTVGEWPQPAGGVCGRHSSRGAKGGACRPCPLPFLPGMAGEALWGTDTHGLDMHLQTQSESCNFAMHFLLFRPRGLPDIGE